MTVMSLFLAFSLVAADRAEPPTIAPDSATMALDDVGLYAFGYAYRGQPEKTFPIGWSGHFDEKTGVTCQEMGEQNGKRALLMHCPWRGGTGVAFQEFRFQVPQSAKRTLLRGATAMRPDALGPNKSDGVTFRVFANGQKLLEVHRTDAAWQPFEFDLTKSAGKILTVRFETDPGPKNNSSFDFSIWGDRQIVFEGFAPKAAAHPVVPPINLRALGSRAQAGAVPSSAFVGQEKTSHEGETAVLRYEGPDGTIEYRWSLPKAADDPFWGRLEAHAQMKGDQPVTVSLGTTASLEWAKPATLGEARWVPSTVPGIQFERSYKVGDQTAKLQIIGRIVGKSLVLEVSCEEPQVVAFDAGRWGPSVRRKSVPVPYLSGTQVEFLPVENLFTATTLDWTASNATSHENARAHYQALTNHTRNKLRERAIFTAAWHVDEVLPNVPNPPSPFLKDLSDRIVLDIWGGRYEDIAQKFEMLADRGITHCVALIHDWQRDGYDNGLPAHVPAEAKKGGDAGMKVLVETGVRLGYRVALHENYVDYYTNYEHFDEKDIALDSAGKKQLAWYNPGTKMQSFAIQPNAILRLAATQSPEVHKRYGTNANYLDVHSSVPPWFHVDQRAGEEGAGMFQRVWDVHTKLWQYERDTHGGPVFGEGNNHWYWSGLLDGAEAQFGSGWPGNQGETAPLIVDFDLLKIHPLQFNHGMGYYERWWAEPKRRHEGLMTALDQYRMQEAIFGHAGFLGGSAWMTLPMAWLEHHLLSPVMARYATAKPAEVQYEVQGKWVNLSEAVRLGANFQRARVRYDNGLTITANQSPSVLTVGTSELPLYGWVAEGAGITAGTMLRNGAISDFAETADSTFANARTAGDWDISGKKRIAPSVGAFEQTGPRAFRFAYRWQVHDRLSRDYTAFVHFYRPGAGEAPDAILFQQDHGPTVPTSKWRPGKAESDGPYTLQLPANLPDGDYVWAIGLFRNGEARLSLEGDEEGGSRIRLGTLHVTQKGQKIAFEPSREPAKKDALADQDHLNHEGQVVDFGSVKTDGSVLIRREGNEWVMLTLPRDRNFKVELSAKRFGRPPTVQSKDGSAGSIKPTGQGKYWSLTLNGAHDYRWPAK